MPRKKRTASRRVARNKLIAIDRHSGDDVGLTPRPANRFVVNEDGTVVPSSHWCDARVELRCAFIQSDLSRLERLQKKIKKKSNRELSLALSLPSSLSRPRTSA